MLSAKIADFQRVTNIPRDSVKWRCRILGLRFQPARKSWGREEVGMLLDMAGEYPLKEIAKRLGRSHDSVKIKISLLGHSGRVSRNGFTVGELATALGVSTYTINRWTTRGWLNPYGGEYSQACVRRFLFTHLSELNLARCDQEWLKGELAEMLRCAEAADEEMAA